MAQSEVKWRKKGTDAVRVTMKIWVPWTPTPSSLSRNERRGGKGRRSNENDGKCKYSMETIRFPYQLRLPAFQATWHDSVLLSLVQAEKSNNGPWIINNDVGWKGDVLRPIEEDPIIQLTKVIGRQWSGEDGGGVVCEDSPLLSRLSSRFLNSESTLETAGPAPPRIEIWEERDRCSSVQSRTPWF